jgi:5S rRNA maturation endonuclease (ribonuclease M5)
MLIVLPIQGILKIVKSYYKYKDNKDWVNFKEKLDYLKNSIEPHYLLESLGIEVDRETPKEIRSACYIHGGDNKTAFRFNKETKTWVCFTHKCHDIHGNDIIGLIKAVTGRDFMAAVKHLQYLVGDVSEVDYIESKRRREIDEFVKSYDIVEMKPKSVCQTSLDKFKILRSNYFLKEGFSKETLDHFEIAGGWQDKHGLIRDIIPIRNYTGELVAYSLRDTREGVPDDFKYILTPGFDKDNCLYNLDKAQYYVDELPLIVVEGFKSVWRLYDYGIKNVVAVMGSGITEGQQFLLCAHAFKGAVIFFDNDFAGVSGTTKALNDLHNRVEVSPVFIQEVDENGKGLDPADLTKEQVYEYLETYF